MYCTCGYDPDLIQGQGYSASAVPKISENCTFLDLSPFGMELKTDG